MNYADIKTIDVANGPGIRVSLFVSGCTHHCKGCFNEETWDFNFGAPFTVEQEDYIMELLAPSHINGLTLLGGDPMEPSNMQALLPLLRRVKEKYPNKPLWCFTGYLFEDICGKMSEEYPWTKEFLSYIDILVDGPFIEAKKNLNLRFKGSENQRTIKVPESLTTGELVLWDPVTGE